MNIFVLSIDPQEAAEWHVDKHVVKMPLESAQLLCTALGCNGFLAPYKQAFVKHPCSIWATKTKSNFSWLCELGLALCKEFTYRYGGEHACEKVIRYCKDVKFLMPEGPLTSFAQAMPDEYKDSCPFKAYREYYIKGKAHLSTWKNRDKPWWYK